MVRPKPHSRWVWAAAAVWLVAAALGLWFVASYDNAAGVAATPPRQWPAGSTLVPAADRSTLVFVGHPQCPCTHASLGELAEVLARAPNQAKTYVLFLRPTTFAAGWEKTDLWQSAARLPGVIVLRDDDGAEARRFGVETSGQTFLYDSRGSLIFSGGLTGSRGHAGDNAGRAALLALLTHGQPPSDAASVFGCPLFASGA